MDLENQRRVKDLAQKHDKDSIVVVVGGAEAEAAGLAAETVISGDPTFAGPLAGVALDLQVIHAIEDKFKNSVDLDVYNEQIGMMEMVLDKEEITEEMEDIRG